MRLWFSSYALQPLRSLGSREGALLKIETHDGLGFSDLHPWPELGDEPIAEQLRLLANDRPTKLSQRSIELAALDREARSKGVSAFAGYTVPDSHFLVNDVAALSAQALADCSAEGFRTLKIKLGRNPRSEVSILQTLATELSIFQLRLDFNGMLSVDRFGEFIDALPNRLCSAIEFVEDPTRWDSDDWRKMHEATGINLARDRCHESEREVNLGAFQWLILKPAIQVPCVIRNLAKHLRARICVTSYLDHPVGQVGAALEAARLQTAPEICGLLSHRSYAPNNFSQFLAQRGPRFTIPSGAGIGFADLLEDQKWEELQ